MSEKIVQLNEEIIKGQIKELVCSTPEPGATTSLSVGWMPTPSPSAREANTGSPVSSRAITWPATGAFTTVVAAAAAAGASVLVAVAVAVAVVAAGAASLASTAGAAAF